MRTADPAPTAWVPARVLGVELLDELRGMLRDPAALFFSVAMPVGFYALFSAMFGTERIDGVAFDTTMLATFGAYGAVATLPCVLLVLVAMSAVTLARPGPGIDAPTMTRLIGVLVLGALPFALLGLAVGFVASANATAAVLHAVLIPSAVASGLWMPLELLPAPVQAVAPFLPTYHLGELALAQLTGEPAAGHALVLALTALVLAGLAALSYRRLQL